MASQQQASTTPAPLRDCWQTPGWLFDWAALRFGPFILDLAANAENAKCQAYIDIDGDSLSVPWHQFESSSPAPGYLWCNPPYSEPGKWLAKAWEEAQRGARIVLLVPTPNGEQYWADSVFGKASEIVFISGRVAFELPDADGRLVPKTGNTRGSCLVVFNRRHEGGTLTSWITRDEMKAESQAA